jgi:hypothetical protein
LDLSYREETKQDEDDEASEKTNPRISLEEEYLETEKKVPTLPLKKRNLIFKRNIYFTS